MEHFNGEIENNFIGLKPWKMYFDGSSYSGGVGVGILIISPEEIPMKFQFDIQPTCSNNEAEYEALIAGLEILISKGARQVFIRGDYQLVVKQLLLEYKCMKTHLIGYLEYAKFLIKHFDEVSIEHVPRIENSQANELAQIASGYQILIPTLSKLIEVRKNLFNGEVK